VQCCKEFCLYRSIQMAIIPFGFAPSIPDFSRVNMMSAPFTAWAALVEMVHVPCNFRR